MPGIVFMTMVSQPVFSSNDTEDFFKEPRPGMVSGFLPGDSSNAMFVYDRCGRFVDELKLLPAPSTLLDIKHEW